MGKQTVGCLYNVALFQDEKKCAVINTEERVVTKGWGGRREGEMLVKGSKPSLIR